MVAPNALKWGLFAELDTMAIVKAPMVLLRSRWSNGFCSIGDVDGSTMKWHWTAMVYDGHFQQLRWNYDGHMIPKKNTEMTSADGLQWELIFSPFAMVSISRWFQ